jgi:hypothetical protein
MPSTAASCDSLSRRSRAIPICVRAVTASYFFTATRPASSYCRHCWNSGAAIAAAISRGACRSARPRVRPFTLPPLRGARLCWFRMCDRCRLCDSVLVPAVVRRRVEPGNGGAPALTAS